MSYRVNDTDLVTDRTNDDVAELKALIQKGLANMTAAEKTKYLAGMKGAYNVDDVLRVQAAAVYLHTELGTLPDDLRNYAFENEVEWQDEFDVPYAYPLTALGDWSETEYSLGDLMSSTDRAEMLRDVRYLGGLLDTVAVNFPSQMERMTVFGANAIEQTLGELDVAYEALKADRKAKIDAQAIYAAFIDADGKAFMDADGKKYIVLQEET